MFVGSVNTARSYRQVTLIEAANSPHLALATSSLFGCTQASQALMSGLKRLRESQCEFSVQPLHSRLRVRASSARVIRSKSNRDRVVVTLDGRRGTPNPMLGKGKKSNSQQFVCLQELSMQVTDSDNTHKATGTWLLFPFYPPAEARPELPKCKKQ